MFWHSPKKSMIEFEWQSFKEDDDSWEALFVKTLDRDWHLASQEYGTENEQEITRIINEKSKHAACND